MSLQQWDFTDLFKCKWIVSNFDFIILFYIKNYNLFKSESKILSKAIGELKIKGNKVLLKIRINEYTSIDMVYWTQIVIDVNIIKEYGDWISTKL